MLILIGAMGFWWLRESSTASVDVVVENHNEIDGSPAQATSTRAGHRDSDMIVSGDSSGSSAISPTPRRDNQRKPSIVDNTIPTADAIKVLLPLAESGRTDAMNELALRLVWCSRFVGSDEAVIRRNVLRNFYSQKGHEPENDDDLGTVAKWINDETQLLEGCRGIDPALMDKRIDWMERAANGGDIAALLSYGANALNDMHGRDDILMNFDEVARRRQLAGQYLRTALNRGACEALLTLSVAYTGNYGPYDWLFKPDAYLALVYAEAAVRTGIRPSVPAKTLAGVKDPARQATASAQGAALAARHCNTPG